ncbi:MAG: 50S ribosomal protein L11 methyltransferase [Ignavibacteria bacterium]|jgi:ribosomal protein L11 methyltransferase|nr:50S ribosomal protein L11 methyltransferase [Ignavibacteria bacterium]
MRQIKISKISVFYNPAQFEALVGFLYLNGITEFEEKENHIDIYADKENVSEFVSKLFSSFTGGRLEVSIEETEIKNWNAEWEKTIEPVLISNKLVVYPSWKRKEINSLRDVIKIQIDPKMSFGTGHNETTQIVLELMAKHIRGTEKNLLDFGCGTSVLAIAGIKLGVKNAVAIDTDDDSIENSIEYLKANRVYSKVKLYKSDIGGINENKFDIICANIISSVLLEKLPEMLLKLKSGGKMFLSGILASEYRNFISKIKNKVKVKEIVLKGEWAGIYAKKDI